MAAAVTPPPPQPRGIVVPAATTTATTSAASFVAADGDDQDAYGRIMSPDRHLSILTYATGKVGGPHLATAAKLLQWHAEHDERHRVNCLAVDHVIVGPPPRLDGDGYVDGVEFRVDRGADVLFGFALPFPVAAVELHGLNPIGPEGRCGKRGGRSKRSWMLALRRGVDYVFCNGKDVAGDTVMFVRPIPTFLLAEPMRVVVALDWAKLPEMPRALVYDTVSVSVRMGVLDPALRADVNGIAESCGRLHVLPSLDIVMR